MNDLGTVVYKAQGRFRNLRELSKVYSKITTDVARVKNRLKSLYRSRGLSTQQQIYSKNGRNQWIEQLPLAVRSAAQHLYAEYGALTPIKKEAQQQMIHEAHRHPIARKLETTPGLGSVRVAQAMAIILSMKMNVLKASPPKSRVRYENGLG